MKSLASQCGQRFRFHYQHVASPPLFDFHMFVGDKSVRRIVFTQLKNASGTVCHGSFTQVVVSLSGSKQLAFARIELLRLLSVSHSTALLCLENGQIFKTTRMGSDEHSRRRLRAMARRCAKSVERDGSEKWIGQMPLCEFIRILKRWTPSPLKDCSWESKTREAINRKSFAAQALPSQSQKSSLQGTF